MKYKNQDGVELNYTSKDVHSKLVREVVREACKLIEMYDRSCKISMNMAIQNCKKFLRVNFDLDEMSDKSGRSDDSGRSDKWIVEQYNRNRAPKDQITAVEEIK